MRLVRGGETTELWLEGTMVRIDGTLRRYTSADTARAAYAAELAARRAAGFIDMPDVLADLDARLVYADELQLAGDPVGELITVQHALAHAPPDMPADQRRGLERRAADVLDAHHDALFGALAPLVRRPGHGSPARPALSIKWHVGFADELRIEATSRLKLAEIYSELRRLPIARFATRLVVGDASPKHANSSHVGSYSRLVAVMARDGLPGNIRAVVLGDVPSGSSSEVDFGDLRPLVVANPLVELYVKGLTGILGPLRSPHLERLTVVQLNEPLVRAIPRSTLPALRALAVHSTPASSLLQLVIDFGLIDQLTALTLRRASLADADLDVILGYADRFARLELLDLRDNRITPTAAAAARERLPRLQA